MRVPEQSGPLWAEYSKYTEQQFLASVAQRSSAWVQAINLAVIFAREAGEDTLLASQKAVLKMMQEDWSEEGSTANEGAGSS